MHPEILNWVCVRVYINRKSYRNLHFFGWALVWILARKISSQKVWLPKKKKLRNFNKNQDFNRNYYEKQ